MLRMSLPAMPRSASPYGILLGDLAALRRDAFGFWRDVAAAGPVVDLRFGPVRRLVVNDADFARQVTVDHRQRYIKDQRLKRILEAGSDQVLATSDGEDWAWRRQLLQPGFRRSQIRGFHDLIVEETEAMASSWSDGARIDLLSEMKILTMNIIGRALFGLHARGAGLDLHTAYAGLGAELVGRVERLVPAPLWLPTPGNRRLKGHLAVICSTLQRVVDDRRRDRRPRTDLLEVMLAAHGGGRRLTVQQLIFEMSALVFAGHETTATTLAWALALISSHDDVQRRLLEELAARPVAGGTPPTDPRFRPFLRQVVDETLRLYPPLYVISRQAAAADQLGDRPIPLGTRLLIHILGIHRHPMYWTDPDRFDPDRFAEPRHPKGAFLPFMLGERRCLGASLAMAELLTILPRLLQRFRFTLPAGLPRPACGAVLHPASGVPAVVHLRRP